MQAMRMAASRYEKQHEPHVHQIMAMSCRQEKISVELGAPWVAGGAAGDRWAARSCSRRAASSLSTCGIETVEICSIIHLGVTLQYVPFRLIESQVADNVYSEGVQFGSLPASTLGRYSSRPFLSTPLRVMHEVGECKSRSADP